MADPVVFDRFNPPPGSGVDCSGDPGYTQQEFLEESDINRIMGRVARGQELPPDLRVGSYGDFSDAPTFQEAMELLRYGEAQFGALPARTRERFGNDPVRFLEWIHDPGTTLEEANELGLLKEESAKRLAAEVELKAAQAKVASVAVPAGGVVVETLKTTK